jgi:hypothetical protein
MALDIDTSGYETSEESFPPSTIETIDEALTRFVKELNIFASTQEGWKQVPVIWTSAERSFQIKDNKDLRDSSGSLIKPVITIERVSLVKDLSKKGSVFANVPPIDDEKGGVLTVSRQINQHKTSNFANADAKRNHKQLNFRTRRENKVVYETVTIPLPVYVEVSYKINIHAEYQQQINEMLTPFLITTGGINHKIIKGDYHQYEAFVQSDFTQTNNLSSLSSEERKYQTDVDIKVLGYLVTADKNEDQPKIVRRQNAVEVKIPRERTIVGDINEFIKKGFYRE